ncbi:MULTISPECIES: GGDEF domain-containing protein [unclassified Shewanella]|uniref:GGDEF domain-containing protein n=1 Tax=unclassified Shewanella TaxID=196818 RepID=UPI0017806BDC|nr:membrane-associated sensor domain-containing protein [Shewanella sp. WPAGA9]
MQKTTPTFEQQLHFETQQYLAKGCRWLSVLSFILAVVIAITRLLNIPELNFTFTLISILPLALVSLYGAMRDFSLPSSQKINDYGRFYRYILALLLCWITVCNWLILSAPFAQGKVESILHLMMFALSIAFFPVRRLLLFAVLIMSTYMASVRVFFFADELFFPIMKMLSFLGIVISGQQVIEKWFRKSIFKDVENQRLVNELNQLALTDSLTKLSNRRYFDAMLTKEIQHCERSGSAMSIILMDIDFFKKLNDYSGHQRGDECLIELAKLLKHQIKRPRDVCARYGGEEFIVLLPETDIAGAVEVANNIKLRLNQLAFQHPDSLVSEYVTVSQGAAQWQPGINAEQLIKQADDKLYEVKATTRNNIAY